MTKPLEIEVSLWYCRDTIGTGHIIRSDLAGGRTIAWTAVSIEEFWKGGQL